MKDKAESADDIELDEIEIGDLQIDTLSGDIRDAMLMRVRDIKRPWSMLQEAEQIELANGLELAAKELVRRVVRLMSGYTFPRAVVRLQDVKIIAGDRARIEGKVVCANIAPNRDVLGEHAGELMVLVAVDSDNFMGEKEPVKTDPDQPELPVDDEAEDAPGDWSAEDFEAMLGRAEEAIRAEEKPSTSFVQRKFGIGFKKAEYIMKALENKGVVSAPDEAGQRRIMPRVRKPKDDQEGDDAPDEGGED